MSPRFASSSDEQPGRARVVADLLERPEAVGAERLEERGLRLHGDDVRPDRVDDPLAEAGDGRRRSGASEHGLAAQLHRQEVEPRVEPDDELAVLARDRLREPVGEVDSTIGHDPQATRRGSRRRSSATTRSSGGGRRRKPGDDEELLGVLGGERRLASVDAAASPASISSRPAAPRGIVRADDPPARDEERAPEARLARGSEHAQLAPRAAGRARRPARRPPRARRSGRARAQRPRNGGRARAAGASRGAAAAPPRGRRRRSRRAPARRAARAACSRSARSESARRRPPSARPAARGRRAVGPPARAFAGGRSSRMRRSSSSAASSSDPSSRHSTRSSAPSAASTAGRWRSPAKYERSRARRSRAFPT